MQVKQKKVFEKPNGGVYIGTLIDIVDFPNHKSTYNGEVRVVDKILFKWVICHVTNQPYNDKDGNPMTATGFYTASMAKKATLPKIVTQILQAPCPVINDTNDLEPLIGRANQLFITSEPDQNNPGQFFVTVGGLTPLAPGQIPPQSPKGFVRYKNQAKTQAGPQGTPVNTYATREAAAAAAPPPVNFNRPAQAGAPAQEAF